MSLKLRQVESAREGEAPPTAVGGSDGRGFAAEAAPSIGGWLGVFATMLPRRQAESIREELETHLRERVRDLMVGGLNEAESTKRAIAELGEAAELAGKYRALQTEPRRRLIMYGSIFAVAGAALALGISAVTGGRQPEGELAKARAETEAVRSVLIDSLTRAQPEVPVTLQALRRSDLGQFEIRMEPRLRMVEAIFQTQPAAPELKDLKFDVNFDSTPAADVFKFVEEKAGMPVQVNWKQLQGAGLEPKTPVMLRAKGAGADVILRALNETTGVTGEGPIDWRAANGVLEVGTREMFDRREVKLVIYELEGIIAARSEKYGEERGPVVEEVVKLVTEFVYPNGWRENGGDLAKMMVVGDRMFVEAPERFHAQIKWMLEQLPGQKARAEGEGGEASTRSYVIQHITVEEALKALKLNEAIRAINFTDFVVDAARNSVVGKATATEHAMVEAALGQIDTAKVALEVRKRTEDLRLLNDRQVRLTKIVDDRLQVEKMLHSPDLDATKAPELRNALQTLLNQEAATRNEIGALKASQPRAGATAGRVYLSGPVANPGVYALTDGMTLRRLLAAAGGMQAGAIEVTVSDSVDGRASVTQTIPAADLHAADGPDPVIKSGQLVSVR